MGIVGSRIGSALSLGKRKCSLGFKVTWSMTDPVIINTDRGLYCPAGDFHIDAWGAVERNIVTHAHSDHARRGSRQYLTAHDNVPLMRKRLGPEISITSLGWGEEGRMKDVRVSLHPAGHIRGSAQVRLD